MEQDPEKRAEELKNEGNTFFKNKEYRDALAKYEEAVGTMRICFALVVGAAISFLLLISFLRFTGLED